MPPPPSSICAPAAAAAASASAAPAAPAPGLRALDLLQGSHSAVLHVLLRVLVVEGPFRICLKERSKRARGKRSQGSHCKRDTCSITIDHSDHSPCVLLPVSWLLSPPRRSVPIAVLPLGLVQAAASHAATHEQVNHASRGHKPRAIRGETQRTKTDEEPGEVGAP